MENFEKCAKTQKQKNNMLSHVTCERCKKQVGEGSVPNSSDGLIFVKIRAKDGLFCKNTGVIRRKYGQNSSARSERY